MKYNNNQKRELVKNDYNAIADAYTKTFGNDIENYYNYIDKFLSMLKVKSVLDVGCGSGQVCSYINKKGVSVKGIDFSKKLLNIAKANNADISFINEDITKFESKEKFGGIFSKYFLFHLPDEDIAMVLKKLYSMLLPQGKICIILDIPKEEGEHIYIEELDDRQKIYYNYLSPTKVNNFLLNAGFKIIEKIIVEENEQASPYAFGLMVFYAEKDIEL